MTKQVNRAFFSSWSPDMAYVLGFWFADGHMTQSDQDACIAFTTKDLAHLQLIQKAMQAEQAIYTRSDGSYRLTIGSKQLWHDLYQLGGRPAKSLIAKMPFVSQELIHHFVRGFVDGDGCLYWDTGQQRAVPRLNIFGGHKFLQQLALVIEQETGVSLAQVRVHRDKILVLAYSGIKAKVLAKWMYTSGDLALERKAILAQEFGKWELSKFGWKSQAVMTPRMQQILAS